MDLMKKNNPNFMLKALVISVILTVFVDFWVIRTIYKTISISN